MANLFTNVFSEDMQEGIIEAYGELGAIMLEALEVMNDVESTDEEVTEAKQKLAAALIEATESAREQNDEARLLSGSWEDVADAAKLVSRNGKDATKVYSSVTQKVEDLVEAQGALDYLLSDVEKSTDDASDALKVLSSYTGYSTDALQGMIDNGDISPLLLMLASDAEYAGNTLQYLTNQALNASGVSVSPDGSG